MEIIGSSNCNNGVAPNTNTTTTLPQSQEDTSCCSSSSSSSSSSTTTNDDNTTEVLEEEPKNLLISLLSELKIGVDLSKVSLPTFILEPRSLLEKFTDNMIHGDILCSLSKLETPIERIKLITKWYLSAFYFRPKGVKKPYNPILGEIFRARWEYSNNSNTTTSNAILVAEQISHHPPVSCIYISNRKDGYTMTGIINPRSKVLSTSLSMAVIVDGSITLSLIEHNEEYTFTFPTAAARGIVFGTLLTEIVGTASITCKQSNLKVELDFKSKPVFGGEYNIVTGKIKNSNNNETLYNFNGKWDKKIEITPSSKKKNSSNNSNSNHHHNQQHENQVETLWDCTNEKKTKAIIRPISEQEEFESQRLWKNVTTAILNRNQKDATFEKNKLEDEQRKRVKNRKDNNIEWEPRLFKKVGDNWIYKYANNTPYSPNEPKEIETEGIIHFEGTLIKNDNNIKIIEKCGASENEIKV